MTELLIRGACSVSGEVSMPGDKSISHRALMVGAVADGRTVLEHLGPGDDVGATVGCLSSYGVDIHIGGGRAVIEGRGFRSWSAPDADLDCANSGTTMRLLAGLATHHEFTSVFDGDDSLRRRPMDRLVAPLQALGAHVETTDGHPPLRVNGGRLTGATIETGVSSAQVKSSALLAALAADGRTVVTEPRTSRDHTERMLAALGASVVERVDPDGRHRVEFAPFTPKAFDLVVPGDFSSAAFIVGAGVMCGDVTIAHVGLNPTRTAFLAALERMGAEVRTETTDQRLGEPVGTIQARRSELRGTEVDGSDPALQDELPLLAVIATQAEGDTTVRGARELRVKESDRITAIVDGLRALGADIEELDDGFVVHAPTTLLGAPVSAAGDHRIAMALAVAGLVAKGDTIVEGYDAAAVSWPGFEGVLGSLGAEVELR